MGCDADAPGSEAYEPERAATSAPTRPAPRIGGPGPRPCNNNTTHPVTDAEVLRTGGVNRSDEPVGVNWRGEPVDVNRRGEPVDVNRRGEPLA